MNNGVFIPIEIIQREYLRGSLVAEYDLDNNPNDSSGYERNGTEGGGMIYRDGRFSDAANFDGVDDYVEISGNDDLAHNNSFSLSANLSSFSAI